MIKGAILLQEMATAPTISTRSLPSFEGLRASTVRIPSAGLPLKASGLTQRSFRSLVVRAATVVAPKVSFLLLLLLLLLLVIVAIELVGS